MPFCKVADPQTNPDGACKNGTEIFYRTYGHGPTKVLLIIGLAGTHDSWGPQIKGLTGSDRPTDDDQLRIFDQNSREEGDTEMGGGIEVCAFDNRDKNNGKDAIALLDHLGWQKAHVFGHSMAVMMRAMIACKLAAMVPDRVLSLALLNVTGGGFECFPKLDRQTVSIAIRFLKAKTPEQRAAVDLDTHYTKEYVKGISSTGMQSNYGFEGQINACWTHKMTQMEIEVIRSAGFLVSVIHGRHDIIAQIYYAKRLAEKLQPVARMIDLHGGHLVSHERTKEVNQALHELIKASELKVSPHDWTNLPQKKSGILRPWKRDFFEHHFPLSQTKTPEEFGKGMEL
ncbi:hypothetical protein GH714_036069 [Hevea brasiliensis]|uniref:AB hydrolase-1 domain-containing protein n=1 Tax=Hevea brasiliensis TaxID=3981 RepID=A0A6A6KUQ3_HEVBR|nr:hypothetical protein GH714_036069 [Hevea brasiliensis]